MHRGKRWLAGLAAGALGLGLLAAVNAPQAQAAGVFSVYCSGGSEVTIPGFPGIPPDPTTVVTDCSVPSGTGNLARVSATGFLAAPVTYVQMSIEGDAVWNTTTGSFLAGLSLTPDLMIVSADGKTLTIDRAELPEDLPVTPLNFANQLTMRLTSNSPGQVTVTTYVSTAVDISLVNTNKALQGTFEVAAYGAPVALVAAPLASAIPNEFVDDPFAGLTPVSNTTWVGAVVALDAAGNFYPLNPVPGSMADDPGTVQFIQTPGANRDVLEFTGAPVFDVDGDPTPAVSPFAVGILSVGPTSGVRLYGTNNYSVGLLATNPSLTASGSYVVSSTLGGSYTASFDKAEYNRGERATLTVCVNDLNGLIVPDGLAWDDTPTQPGPVDRFMGMTFNVETVVPLQPLIPEGGGGFETDTVTGVVSTLNGCVDYVIRMPESNVDFTVMLAPSNGLMPTMVTSNGWAAGVTGPASVTVKVGDGGGPTPPPPAEPAVVLVEAWRDQQDRARIKGVTEDIAAGEVLNIRVSAYNEKAQRWTKWRVVDTTTVTANGTYRAAFERKGELRVRVAYPKVAISNIEFISR